LTKETRSNSNANSDQMPLPSIPNNEPQETRNRSDSNVKEKSKNITDQMSDVSFRA
jgi:hypothetical protein